MKKIILITLVILVLIGCSQPDNIADYVHVTDPGATADDPRLIHTWVRADLAWHFYIEGDFIYYEISTGNLINTGFYMADPVTGQLYIEDPIEMESHTFIYDVLVDYPNEGDTTLQWATIEAPANLIEYLREEN